MQKADSSLQKQPPEVFLRKGVTNLQENIHAEVWFQ